MRPHRLIVVGCISLFSVVLSSQTVLVVPSQYSTIQSAISAAPPGAIVSVDPGVYSERIDMLGKDIVVRSSAGPWRTFVDGTSLASPFVQTGGTPVTARFEGFTVTGVPSAATNLYGTGGIETATTSNSFAPTGLAEISDCIIVGVYGALIGGIHLSFSPTVRPRLSRTIIAYNSVSPNGSNGGIGISTGGAGWIIEDCVVLHNYPNGAAARPTTAFAMPSNEMFRRCDFIDNQPNSALHFAGVDYTGAVTLTVTFDGCRFFDNAGGAVTASGLRQRVQVTNCLFRGNTATNGAGINLNSVGGATIRDCVFDGNHAVNRGGGIAVNGRAQETVSIAQSTFYGNTAGVSGSAVFATQASGSLPFVAIGNCILRGNSGPQLGNSANSTYVLFSDIEGGWSGPGLANFDADPLWRDPTRGDFRTLPGSPVIDAGHPAGVWDEDGTLPDVGAFLNQTFGPHGDSLVTDGQGDVWNSLLVGGSFGGTRQVHEIPIGGSVDLEIRPTPALAASTEWLLYGYIGVPTTGQTLPAGFGNIVMPSPFSGSDPDAVVIATSFGGFGVIAGQPAPWRSPTFVVGFPLELTFQAIVRTADAEYRSSNAIRLVAK